MVVAQPEDHVVGALRRQGAHGPVGELRVLGCYETLRERDVDPHLVMMQALHGLPSDEGTESTEAMWAQSGRSLQEYLRSELTELAGRPDPAVLMAQVRERTRRTGSRLSASQILAHRDHDRG